MREAVGVVPGGRLDAVGVVLGGRLVAVAVVVRVTDETGAGVAEAVADGIPVPGDGVAVAVEEGIAVAAPGISVAGVTIAGAAGIGVADPPKAKGVTLPLGISKVGTGRAGVSGTS